jgi:hypothetical protein
MEGANAVAECAKRMPDARRVRARRNEADDVPAGGDEVVPADVLLDARSERSAVHAEIVASC